MELEDGRCRHLVSSGGRLETCCSNKGEFQMRLGNGFGLSLILMRVVLRIQRNM